LKEKGGRKEVRKHLLREIGRNRIELWLATFAHRDIPGALPIAGFFRRLIRYSWAVYRRTPAYPKLEALELDAHLRSFHELTSAM
jgi:hypothetical protein